MRLLFILLISGLTFCLYGQNIPTLSCTTDQEVYNVDYPIKITYSLSFDGKLPNDIKEDILKHLTIPKEILTRKIKEENGQTFHYLNGKRESNIIRSFTIKIEAAGSFTIPIVSLDYKGTKLSTAILILDVFAKDSTTLDSTEVELSSKVFIRGELENGKETCVPGEQIIINTVIYTQIAIEKVEMVTSMGDLNFIRGAEETETVELDGKQYIRKCLESNVYHPLEIKEVLLPPAKVLIGRISDKKKGVFNPFELLTDTLSSNALLLKVEPVSENGATYLAKNGIEMKLSWNDSLIDKGIILLDVALLGTGNSLFYKPLILDFKNRATVETLYLGQKYLDDLTIKKNFQYVIHCHEAGAFDINLDWITWNTKRNILKINRND
jgi:hypothetical protein